MEIAGVLLLFTVCGTNGAAPVCEHISQPWQGDVLACIRFAEPQVARWIAEHPGLELVGGYTCSTEKRA